MYEIVIDDSGTTQEVYCDMEGDNCGGEGGWTRVAFVNMTDPTMTCPTGLVERDFTASITRRLCSIDSTGCTSTFFSTYGLTYEKVCGRLIGYQFRDTRGICQIYSYIIIDCRQSIFGWYIYYTW